MTVSKTKKKIRIAKKAAYIIKMQILETKESKKEIRGMIKDAESDFINGGYEEFDIEDDDPDIMIIGRMQSSILRKQLL